VVELNLRRGFRTVGWEVLGGLILAGTVLAMVVVFVALPVALVYVIGHFIVKFW
jgi:hypothetical protein